MQTSFNSSYGFKQSKKKRYNDDDDWGEVRQDKKAKKPKKDSYDHQRRTKRGEE